MRNMRTSISAKHPQERNLKIQSDFVIPNKYYSDFECDLYLFCENISRGTISKRKIEYDEKMKLKKLQTNEASDSVMEIEPESPPSHQSTSTSNTSLPTSNFYYPLAYINTLPRQYADCRGELIVKENKTNDWKEDDKEKEKKKENKHHHRHNSDNSLSSCSTSESGEETSSYSSYSATRSEEEEEDYHNKHNKSHERIKSSSLPENTNNISYYRLNQENYSKERRCPIQFVFIRYRGYSSFLHAIKSCVWGTTKGIATSLQSLYDRGSHILLCFSETKSNSIQGIASMASPIYICKSNNNNNNFCHIFRIHWDMIHTVKFNELQYFEPKDIKLEIDFDSGRDILNMMSGGIHSKQEKISLTNNLKLSNPWKYKYLRQEALNREIIRQKIRYEMIQYDTAKIYGLTGYFLPNIKFIMNPFLPHDNNPKKTMQRY